MKRTIPLSKLMHLSWEIQKRKKYTRSKSLQSAWVITLNEDITVYYLVKKHSHINNANKVKPESIGLFK